MTAAVLDKPKCSSDNRKMKRKHIWIGAAVFAAALFLFFTAAPSLLAEESSKKENSPAEISRYLQIFEYVFSYVQNHYVDEVDARILYEGALRGMLENLEDPYTSYIDSEDAMRTSLNDTTQGSFGGVGLSIMKPLVSTPEKPAYVEVASPIEGTPGARSGIQAGDLIIEINGTDTSEITMEEVLSHLRGPAGTDVQVLIRRGKAMEFPVTLTRAVIEVPTVKYEMMEGGTGYLRIVEFTPLTPDKVREALQAFAAENFSALILDLRNNPGGLITSVINVADQFLESGTIVSTRSRIPFENRTFSASGGKTEIAPGIPVVVLINKGSASASEILAGALKDHKRAYLVGETTYGKGSVQQVLDLLNNDMMKITVARYYTPSGANIDKQGIPPDLAVSFPELTEDEEKALSELLNTTEIADFVEKNPDLTPQMAETFAKTLQEKYPANLPILKRLVMQEYYRTHTAPLYDLEYDVQLRAAVDLLKQNDIAGLISATKTVQEIQAESPSGGDE